MFTRSHRNTRPPLVDLQPGDRAVLFLKSPRGGAHMEFVSPFYGKDAPDYTLLQDLRTMSKDKGLAAEVEIAIFLDAPSAASGAPAPVRVRISNKSAVAVIFGSTPAPGQVLIVTGPDGRGLAMRPGARDLAAARIPLYLPGGGVFEYRADLAQFFDLSHAGAYTVQAMFDPPAASGAWSGTLTSQVLPLAVE
jgi:hypothetical protein